MRVLLSTFGSFGDLNPYIALALGLRERGHESTIAAPAFYRETVEREGLSFASVRPDADMEDREMLARAMDPKTGIVFLLEEVLLPVLRESFDDLRQAADGCDLLVTHPLVYAGPVLADATGLPWASTALSPLPFMSAQDPPVLSPLLSLAWLRNCGRVPNALLFGLGRLAVGKWAKPIRALRSSLGLSPGKNPIYEGQFSPSLTLALFSEVLGRPQSDWPANTVQTGFLPYDGSHGLEGLSEPLTRFLDEGEAPVVFTLGTSGVASGGGFFEAGLIAARELGLRSVIVGEPDGPWPDAADVLRIDSAPFGELFPRASIVVHAGGVGTLGLSLRSGRPSLVVPIAHDQPDNALRLVRQGVARMLAPKKCSAQRVAEELSLLSRSDYTDRAAEVALRVAAEPGVAGACDALEALVP